MNTTMQIRINQAEKSEYQKMFKKMGLDLSSGIKFLLAREKNPENITYVCDYGYLHKYTPEMLKKFQKEARWAVKYEKGYASAKEMHDDIMKR
ncbi:hypothetical protein A2456_03525 [Candidatus Nomurabacteria bacterium RIFOXYC2_FULL_36_19]|uniref:Antitoxin n=1 Tax=Candidatus Nomurabacteria bacterium RIFOXYC2_FULL_36_19 TaxID=1801806 RepID=A0A1F6YT72_9BACT|nr:MAG: hypothetical protein A2238_03230 [Candidatus Nomurabacteria bacterium RIFOXYA2_FULL_35_9]OGJ09556.1 MAG: hypothetical protein A2456_03525 [Candidatus Nomurabacteria bacterium RIFOXYC2_FULL_36_19]